MNVRLLTIGAALATTLLVAGCGGGGGGYDDEMPPPQDVPDSALATPAGFTRFAGGLAESDTAEPLNLDRIGMAPASETDEPAALN
jgi:hypothetical protein